MKKEQLIKLARELTEENYCFGFDTFVECYDKAEWLEFFEDYEVTTKAKLITALNESASMRSSMAGDRECYYVCETGKCDVENTRDNPKEFCDCNFYPSPDPEELHWQKEERRLNNFHPIPIKGT
jgi:hypothetical protein